MAVYDYGRAFREGYDHGERRQRRANQGRAMRSMRNALASRDPRQLEDSLNSFLDVNEPDHYAWARQNVFLPNRYDWRADNERNALLKTAPAPQAPQLPQVPATPYSGPEMQIAPGQPGGPGLPQQPQPSAQPQVVTAPPPQTDIQQTPLAPSWTERLGLMQFNEAYQPGGARGDGMVFDTPSAAALRARSGVNTASPGAAQPDPTPYANPYEPEAGPSTYNGDDAARILLDNARPLEAQAVAPTGPITGGPTPAAAAAPAPTGPPADGGFQGLEQAIMQAAPPQLTQNMSILAGLREEAMSMGDLDGLERISALMDDERATAVDLFGARLQFSQQMVTALRRIPEQQRLPVAMHWLQNTPYAYDTNGQPLLADDIMPMLQNLGRDGIQDSELDALEQMTLTYAQRLDENYRNREGQRARAGQSPGYAEPTPGEIQIYERNFAAEDQREQALYSLDSLEAAFMSLARNSENGTILPDNMNTDLARLAGSTGRQALLEDIQSNTWPLLLQALQGLQPISEGERQAALRGIVSGQWTLESAINFLRKSRAALLGSRALSSARRQFIYEAGSLQRGVDAQGRRWSEVERTALRPYTQANWAILADAPQDGREVQVPQTGDFFRFDAQSSEPHWAFVRHGDAQEQGAVEGYPVEVPVNADAWAGSREERDMQARANRSGRDIYFRTRDGRRGVVRANGARSR
jgi:hypothetical protein